MLTIGRCFTALAERTNKLGGSTDTRRLAAGRGGWNRIHLIVSDTAAEVAQLLAAGPTFRNDIVAGPGGQQILLEDPSGNVVELFQPAGG